MSKHFRNMVASSAASLLLLITIALVPGCFNSDGSADLNLQGPIWILQFLEGESVEPPEGFDAPTLSIVEEQVAGESVINHFTGPYSLDGDQLSFGNLISTRMAGPPAAMDLEQRFLNALGRVKAYGISGSQLTLYDADGASLLVFAADEQ